MFFSGLDKPQTQTYLAYGGQAIVITFLYLEKSYTSSGGNMGFMEISREKQKLRKIKKVHLNIHLSDFSSIFPLNLLQPIKAQDLNSFFFAPANQKLRIGI